VKTGLAKGLLVVGALSLSAAVVTSARVAGAAATASAASSAKGETALGDFAADAVRAAAKADIALVPASVLDDRDLPPNATADAVRAALLSPAEPVTTIKVTGKQLLGALERSVSLAPRKNQGFLQVSGISLVFDAGRPEGSRVVDAAADGAGVKPDKTYAVAMPDSLARGALGYFKFWDARDAKPVLDAKGAKVTLLDALLARLKTNKPAATPDTRIKGR